MKIHTTVDEKPLRAAAYPDIGDQLDALWKGFDALLSGAESPESALAMLAQIKSVKEKYPKP